MISMVIVVILLALIIGALVILLIFIGPLLHDFAIAYVGGWVMLLGFLLLSAVDIIIHERRHKTSSRALLRANPCEPPPEESGHA